MPTSKGEVWLVLENGCRAVEATRHPRHMWKDECVIELVLAPVEGELKAGDRVVFRIERSHALSEVIKRYTEGATENDVLVVMPGQRLQYAVMPRQRFHEAVRTAAVSLRSDMAKYIR